MDGTALEYMAPIGLFLDIVGFTLVFWKGDFFSPRVFAGSGPPPPDFLGRSGDQFLQYSDDPTTDQDEKRWYKGRYDRWVGLIGAALVVIGFALQIVPYVVKLLC